MATAPPGTQAATLNIEAAYRTVPVWPPHKCFLVVKVDGSFFIDHTFPSRLATTGGVQGNIVDTTVDILHSMELRPIKKWLDDHIFFRYPSGGGSLLPDGTLTPFTYSHNLVDVYTKSRPLGVPWHPKKWRNYAFIFIYLSFLWDLILHTVTLPDDKCLKYRNKLVVILDALAHGKRMSCKDAMSINGTLSHIAFIIPHGHAYLANLSSFISEFSFKFTSRHPHTSVVMDLKWWLGILEHDLCPRSLVPHGLPQDINLWVDASTDWGIGMVLSERWNLWTLCPGWKGQGRDIGWLEALTVELAVRSLFEARWKDAAVIIHSDNQGVIGAFQHSHSWNFQVNMCIHQVELIAMSSNISHTLIYTESA